MSLRFILPLFFLISCTSYKPSIDVENRIFHLDQVEELNASLFKQNISLYEVLDSAESQRINELRIRTKKILEKCEQIKDQAISYCGGYDENGYFIGPECKALMEQFFISENYAGELKLILNSQLDLLESWGNKPHKIARDAKEIPIFKYDPNQRHKSFSEVYFANITMVDALIRISILQCQVLENERNYLYQVLMKKAKNN